MNLVQNTQQNGAKIDSEAPGMSVADRLITQHQSKAQWKQEAKKILEEKELKECTFQPKLAKKRKTTTTVAVDPPEKRGDNARERLYRQRNRQIDKADKAKEDYEFERMGEECTFAPKVNKNLHVRSTIAQIQLNTNPVQKQDPSPSSTAAGAKGTLSRAEISYQKQLERQKKAREEKQRVKNLTERGVYPGEQSKVAPNARKSTAVYQSDA